MTNYVSMNFRQNAGEHRDFLIHICFIDELFLLHSEGKILKIDELEFKITMPESH